MGGETKIMPFFWKCPCGDQNYYKGIKTTDAITTCSACSLKSRIFQYKIVVSIPQKPPKTTPKPQALEYNGMVKSLIIALNYAINTIKNKKPVVDKDVNSTWYIYWRDWTRIRTYFQSLEGEKL